MTNPTDTNQASEDELRAEILTEFKQVHRLAPADYTENCTNVVMSIVQAHTNSEIAKVLDRLQHELDGGRAYTSVSLIEDAIQAERAKLKEVK